MDSSLVRVRRPLPKPLMLKDHLLDEMSSCSSNGFRSFPRRSPHCFTAARFPDPPSKSSPISALRSAVAAVAKRLSRKPSPPSSLARILSRRLLEGGGFWKRKEWKPVERLMKEDSDRWARPDSSRSSCWGSGFAASPHGGSPAEGEAVNGVAKDGPGNGAVSSEQKKQSSDQEKEQFSPVSVLDYPFGDEDDEVSSVFQQRLARMEGTKLELVKKIKRFECLAKLEPVSLAAQFDNESLDSNLPRSLDEKSISDIEVDEGKEAEYMALELLCQMKDNHYQDQNLKGNLLLDFFKERISNNLGSSEKQRGLSSFDRGLLEEAEDWINEGKPREVFGRWEVEKNRRAYLVDMEKRGEWRTLDQEREEVGLELENEVFDEVMNELLLEIWN